MKINIESPWIQAGIKITNILILNFWFVIGCIPVLTIGTSIIAASSVCLKLVEDREESTITASFWKAWKANLGVGILYTAAGLALLWVIWMNWQIFDRFTSAPIVCLLAAILGGVLMVMHFLYAFLLEARYENKPFAAMLNSRKICVRFFVRTLGLAGALFVQYLLFYQTSALLSYIGLFCAPILMIYTICKVGMPILHQLEKDTMAHDGFAVYTNH